MVSPLASPVLAILLRPLQTWPKPRFLSARVKITHFVICIQVNAHFNKWKKKGVAVTQFYSISICKFNCFRNFYLNRTLLCNYWISIQNIFKTCFPIETSDEMTRLPVHNGMIGDHAHLWLCFKPSLKGMDYIKFFLYSTNMTVFFLFPMASETKFGLCHKSTFAKALDYISNITVKTTMFRWNSPGIIIWSLGITYFRWLYAPLFKSEPWILKLSKISEQFVNLKQILRKSWDTSWKPFNHVNFFQPVIKNKL